MMFNDGGVFPGVKGRPQRPPTHQHPLQNRGSLWPLGAGLGAP